MILRLLLRVLSLAAKFGLTIVIARSLGFSAVADYGLAVAVSVVASKLFGLGFSTELNRRLSATDPTAAIGSARLLRGIYSAFYLLLFAGMAFAWYKGWLQALHASSTIVLFEVLLVAVAEHYALEANSYVFSLHRAKAGSLMLFIRTGVWAAFAIGGLLLGMIADMHAVFMLWILANMVVIVWARSIIGKVSQEPAAASSSRSSSEPSTWFGAHGVWTGGIAFYAASVMLSGLQYAERLVAAPFLSPDELGRYVFAWSVANAVQTIAYASIVVTAGPRLAKAASVVPDRFGATLRHAVIVSIALTVPISIGIAVLHGPVFRLAHENPGTGELVALAILLVSFVLRSVADVLWAAAIALKAGRTVAFGMVALVAISLSAAWWIIPGHAQVGVALAHLLASLLVTGWLAWVVRRASGRTERHVHVAMESEHAA